MKGKRGWVPRSLSQPNPKKPLNPGPIGLRTPCIGRNSTSARKDANQRTTRPHRSWVTTTRLRYAGSLNVQGFADTLKLKNAIQLMSEHRFDVLFLSETRATSYYSYISEDHMVVLSGNTRDKHAGVGAIIAPSVRPHLLDILQLSSRILHLTFKNGGGNLHFIGVYAPRSGLDRDSVREPFWDQLESHIHGLPAPEPMYVTGDFNVRFQATHKNDEGFTGRFTYGKGSRYIDHNSTSSRSLCVGAMCRLGMVEAASHITQNPLEHITYKDKSAPPSDWSQFVLDPVPLQQLYTKMHHNCFNSLHSKQQQMLGLTLTSPICCSHLKPSPKSTLPDFRDLIISSRSSNGLTHCTVVDQNSTLDPLQIITFWYRKFR